MAILYGNDPSQPLMTPITDAMYANAMAGQQQPVAPAGPAGNPWIRGLEGIGKGLMIAGSQDPMKAFTELANSETAAKESERRAKADEANAKYQARKVQLEELKASKPSIVPSGVPGYAIALYPDGRQEMIVNDQAVAMYASMEDRKDARQQAMLGNQFSLLDKRLAAQAAENEKNRQAQFERDEANRKAQADRDAAKGGRLNPSLQKAEDADLEVIQGADGIIKSTQPLVTQLQNGQLNLGALRNAYNSSRNFLGKSTPESQAYADLERTITRITNESLRLNKGVQTEGDAQRAAKELTAAFAKNDTALMSKALTELQEINLRAAGSKAQLIDQRRTSQKVEPLFGSQAPITPNFNTNTAPPPKDDPLGLRKK